MQSTSETPCEVHSWARGPFSAEVLEDRKVDDRPYCTAHGLLSACLSALPWGQVPNCWSWRNSVSFVGSHPDGVLFLAPSSNPCIILNKCLNSSSEHGRHSKPPSSAHPRPMWNRHASVCNALSLYNGSYVMELLQPPSSLILLLLSFWGAFLSLVSFISAMCTALSIMLADLCAMSSSNIFRTEWIIIFLKNT